MNALRTERFIWEVIVLEAISALPAKPSRMATGVKKRTIYRQLEVPACLHIQLREKIN